MFHLNRPKPDAKPDANASLREEQDAAYYEAEQKDRAAMHARRIQAKQDSDHQAEVEQKKQVEAQEQARLETDRAIQERKTHHVRNVLRRITHGSVHKESFVENQIHTLLETFLNAPGEPSISADERDYINICCILSIPILSPVTPSHSVHVRSNPMRFRLPEDTTSYFASILKPRIEIDLS